jgi:hypothetical protein
MNEIVYAIKDIETGKFATYGAIEFKEGIRFARLYKSKKTALANYHSKIGKYNNLSLVEINIKTINEETLNSNDFKENNYEN